MQAYNEERPGGYNRADYDDPEEIDGQYLCRCCGAFNDLHEYHELCGDCQDRLEEMGEEKSSALVPDRVADCSEAKSI